MTTHGISNQIGQKYGNSPPFAIPITPQMTTLMTTMDPNPPAALSAGCICCFGRAGNCPGFGVGVVLLATAGVLCVRTGGRSRTSGSSSPYVVTS